MANLVASVTSDSDIIAAAWLHDVLEDVAPHNPEFNAVAILQQFGERVLRILLEVTDISKPSHLRLPMFLYRQIVLIRI